MTLPVPASVTVRTWPGTHFASRSSSPEEESWLPSSSRIYRKAPSSIARQCSRSAAVRVFARAPRARGGPRCSVSGCSTCLPAASAKSRLRQGRRRDRLARLKTNRSVKSWAVFFRRCSLLCRAEQVCRMCWERPATTSLPCLAKVLSRLRSRHKNLLIFNDL